MTNRTHMAIMTAAKRGFLFLLALSLAASILLPAQMALAQTKLSAPLFTVEYVDGSYDVPATYGVDQYTGQTIIKQYGYHVTNQSVVFKIRNQPFTDYTDSDGNTVKLYYNFRFKGHFSDIWSYYPFTSSGRSAIPYNGYSWGTGDLSPEISASNSEYTVTAISLAILSSISSEYSESTNIPNGWQIDFQMQILTGNVECDFSGLLAGSFYNFTGQSSDWSSTQTLKIGSNQTSETVLTPTPEPQTFDNTTPSSSTPTETPTPTATVTPSPEVVQMSIQTNVATGLNWQTIVIAVLAALVIVLAVVVLLQRRRL